MKSPGSSTLDIVQRVRETLPACSTRCPRRCGSRCFDQSIFVRAAVDDVLKEGGSRGLTG